MDSGRVKDEPFEGRTAGSPRRIQVAAAIAAAAIAGCLALDSFFFTGESVDSYRFDAYTGPQECADAMDSVKLWESAGDAPAVDVSSIHPVRIPTADGDSISGALLSPSAVLDTTDTLVLYYHGRCCHIDYYWPRVRLLHATGFPVLIVDYRGFGMSGGTATERSIYEDGMAARDYVRQRLGDPLVSVYAFSMGCMVAGFVTANDTSGRIISLSMEAPIGSYASIAGDAAFLDLPASWVVSFTGDNRENIRSVVVPFLWMHGTEDETLDRETQGLPVWESYPGDEGYWVRVTGAQHTTVPKTFGYRAYVRAVCGFVRGDPTSALDAAAANPDVVWGTKATSAR